MANRSRKQNTEKNQRLRKISRPIFKLGNKIKKIIKVDLESFRINLLFSDGLKSNVSLTHIFSKPKGLAAEILKGGFFERCFVESGALAWPNGFELCPDALRMWIRDQQ